jgi:hypothetical protein
MQPVLFVATTTFKKMLARHVTRRLLPLRPYVPAFRRWNSDAISGSGTPDASNTSIPDLSKSSASDVNASVSRVSTSSDSELASNSNAPEVSSSTSEVDSSTSKVDSSMSEISNSSASTSEVNSSSVSTSSASNGFTSSSQPEIFDNSNSHHGFRVTAKDWQMMLAVVEEHKKRINELEYVARGQEAQRNRLIRQLEQKDNRIKALEDASKEWEQRAKRIKTLEDASKDFLEHVEIPIHLMLLSRHAYRIVTGTPWSAWRSLKRTEPPSKESAGEESPNTDSSAEGSKVAKSHGKSTTADTSESVVAQAAEGNENAQDREDSIQANDTLKAATEEPARTAEDALELQKGFHLDKGKKEDPFKDPFEMVKRLCELKDRYKTLGFQRDNDMVRFTRLVSKALSSSRLQIQH